MEGEIQIVRKEQKWGRSYIVTNGEENYILPSVTTVLKLLTGPKWEPIRKEMGEVKWDTLLDNASYRGTVMHSMLEAFLIKYSEDYNEEEALLSAQLKAKSILDEDPSRAPQVKIGRDLFWNFYHEEFWKSIKRVVHNEIFLWTTFKGGWAGACDFIYEDWNEDHVVIDFKSSSTIKIEEDIESYFCQIAAYMFMYAERYGIMPARGEIWISNVEDDTIQKFIVNGNELKPHLRKFISLLQEFQEKNEIIGNILKAS